MYTETNVSKCWKNNTNRLAQCVIPTDLQLVQNTIYLLITTKLKNMACVIHAEKLQNTD